ncbi:MAG: bifunctional UDP-N-acetylglucosamine diphosphorylase/glucosamine-1-phosphate N-acetyltransferase GlmU [Clostridia bacterium]|nr:bifunctional UDP-N-acetylglucosamine diphosphorylase/glucosamine-1-phosphate N-acetyltransferase GlmU [Clostridia bacterium]
MDKAIVLAAGKGTRMKSKLAKVLQPLNGKGMIQYVVDALAGAGITEQIIVVGHQQEQVRQHLGETVKYAVQSEQLGTGHAVMMAQKEIDPNEDGLVLVVCGDTPLLRGETIAGLIAAHQQRGAAATILTCDFAEPTGYGRIIRDEQGQVKAIVEEKDAGENEKRIKEINTGTYCFHSKALWGALAQIKPVNAQGEYYLTDVIQILGRNLAKVGAHKIDRVEETMGINNKVQLAEAAKVLRHRKLVSLMEEGVTIVDPDSTFIEDEVKIGVDTVIYPFTWIGGETVIGEDCFIGPNTKVKSVIMGNRVTIDQSTVFNSRLGNDCTVGPYAYLRPGTVLADKVKVGDFVELKKSQVGMGSKIPHLSYIGDSFIGAGVNIGAGTITCNYDGVKKYNTRIEDGAFVGSNTNLVAPVVVGKGALIGAGSTITKDIPPNTLAIARSKQINLKKNVEKRGKEE